MFCLCGVLSLVCPGRDFEGWSPLKILKIMENQPILGPLISANHSVNNPSDTSFDPMILQELNFKKPLFSEMVIQM